MNASASSHTRTINKLERALKRITADARHERTLRARTEAVWDAVSDVPCAIFIANDAGHYISANKAAVKLTGYSEARLLKMSVWDLTPDTRLTLGRRLWKDFIARGRMRGVYEICRKDRKPVRAKYFALANVLPGIHVSALLPVR